MNSRLSYEPIVCCMLCLFERIGEYYSQTLNVIADTIDEFLIWLLPWSVLIVSIVLSRSALSFWFDYNYLKKGRCSYPLWRCIVPCLLILFCWFILSLTMMSILPPSNAFLVLMRFATFLQRVRITSYVKLLCYRELIVLDQPGDHTCTEWNDQGCLFFGRNDCSGKTATGVRLLQRCEWLQQPDHLCYITMQV